MATTNQSTFVNLIPDLLSQDDFETLEQLTYGIFTMLYVKESEQHQIQDIYDKIEQNIARAEAPVDVYLREATPPEYNIGRDNIERYGDIVLIPKIGSYIKKDADTPGFISIGQHGYNNSETDMRTIFIGHGPSFKSGEVLPSFQNIEVYNLLCELLDLVPTGNNGTRGTLNDALKLT